MRWVLVLTALVLLSACGPVTVTEVSGAGPGECEDITEAWTADFAEDVEGAASPEEALDARLDEDPSDMPAGEPTREAADDTRARYVFTDDGSYAGDAVVIRLKGGWVVESASRCR